MKPRERAQCALDLEEPDRTPMFELEFQYPEEIIGKGYVLGNEQTGWEMVVFRKRHREMVELGKGIDTTEHNTMVLAETCKKLGYDIIRPVFVKDQLKAIKLLKKIAPNHLIMGSTGGTLGIPDGKTMATIVHKIYTRPDEIKREMNERIKQSIQGIKQQADAGANLVIDCTDFCLKEGPFYPTTVYTEIIFPHLRMLVDTAHKKHIHFIMHTDGNLWPILKDLVATRIDALHSIDPSAGMKLAEIKERYGNKIALCGNVDAATTMAYGTPEQVAKEAKRCIRDAAAGGGYFLTTSNCIYMGVPPVNAITLAKTGRTYGKYPIY